MSRFSKVARCMWGDEKFRALSAPTPNARDLWIYLMTGPHNANLPGLFVLGVAAMAEALEWPVDATRACFDEIVTARMARFDAATRLVWLPNALRHNTPENANVVVGWRAAWAELPECALRDEAEVALEAGLVKTSEAFARGFAIARGKAPPNPSSNPRGNPGPKGLPKPSVDPSVDSSGKASPKALPKGSPKQEQEQEQEQDPDQSAPADAGPSPAAGAPSPGPVAFDGVVGQVLDALRTDAELRAIVAAPVDLAHRLADPDAYPAVDVLAQVKLAANWLAANPKNRKKNGARFLTGWLARAQERAPRVEHAPPAAEPDPPADDGAERRPFRPTAALGAVEPRGAPAPLFATLNHLRGHDG